jgi:hypothetical protein
MTKITQDEFLDRIMTNDSSIQEAFTIDGLKALHGSLYDFYSQTLAKEFDVIRLLTSWHEFNNLETAKAYCKRELKHCNYKDIIIVFDTGVLILG